MTGRRLYDALTDAWSEQYAWAREKGGWFRERPPAWSFLSIAERQTLNAAARKLTPPPRRK